MDKNLMLVLGGARSGKSAFAIDIAQQAGAGVLFVATAVAGDEEMARRIQRHKQTRPKAWVTLEAPANVGAAIEAQNSRADVVLVDCVGVLVSNLLLELVGSEPDRASERLDVAEHRVADEVADLLRCYEETPASFIIVSNEVGLGLVPPNALGRVYRDVLGTANQTLARAADQVYLLVAGIPLALKACRGKD
ncbi:MAG: bifunctional adenosylcobinamide kinase/adenosylcobinamide-phosphate guanylyltransferase [Chloroflexi bacterium]|nr:bifunctional adenosylcobinamide kinase/adenosylcobinamide-phosphate guanylyltransferase [Chloroflexota bacterium]